MKLFKGLFVLVMFMTLGMAFAQDSDSDTVDITIEVPCVRLIDAASATTELTLDHSDEAGDAFAVSPANTIDFTFDYTVNCDSASDANPQDITLGVTGLSTGIVAAVSGSPATDGTGTAFGTAATGTAVTAAGTATSPAILTGVDTVATSGTTTGTASVEFSGLSASNVNANSQTVTFTFTVSDQ